MEIISKTIEKGQRVKIIEGPYHGEVGIFTDFVTRSRYHTPSSACIVRTDDRREIITSYMSLELEMYAYEKGDRCCIAIGKHIGELCEIIDKQSPTSYSVKLISNGEIRHGVSNMDLIKIKSSKIVAGEHVLIHKGEYSNLKGIVTHVEEDNDLYRVEVMTEKPKYFDVKIRYFKRDELEVIKYDIERNYKTRRFNRIITIVGSMRFYDEMLKEAEILTADKNVVLLPFKSYPEISSDECGIMMTTRISISDGIYVLNKDGYIGETTKQNIQLAKILNKSIQYYDNENKGEYEDGRL